MSKISPKQVLADVAAAIPAAYHKNVIVIGSLAAGYHFFDSQDALQVRTKDIDCVLSPHLQAVKAGKDVAETLLAAGWRSRGDGPWAKPGNQDTLDDDLPAVRLYPPASDDWFVELLGAPDPDQREKRLFKRLVLISGHYGLPSFRFLSIATFRPVRTDLGIYCARPEMMALANLLEHPRIGTDTMSGLIEDRAIKRSNKDLGRVLAISRLSTDEEMASWPRQWGDALSELFRRERDSLRARVGDGIRALIKSENDLEEAVHACNYGLLASRQVTLPQLRATAARLLVDVLEPLEQRRP